MVIMLTTRPSQALKQSALNLNSVPTTFTSKTTKLNSKINLYKAKGSRIFKASNPSFRNPYLNFLRDFRQRNLGLSPVETVRRGAKEWKDLSNDSKVRYMEEAFHAPRKRENEQTDVCIVCPRPRRKKSSCRPKKRSCRPKRKRSCKPKKRRRKSRCARRRKTC